MKNCHFFGKKVPEQPPKKVEKTKKKFENNRVKLRTSLAGANTKHSK